MSATPTDPTLLAILERLTDRLTTSTPDSSSKGPDARAPDRFSGIDRSKLQSFLAACRTVFLYHPGKFTNDRAKVLYAASYLDGVAASWFEPNLFKTPEPDILSSYSIFEEKLKSMFGEPNEEAAAERKLQNLRMSSHHRVAHYITDFLQLASKVRWNEYAKMAQFRKGLSDRIKDFLVLKDKIPDDLEGLMDVALQLDLRYWDREEERRHQNPRHEQAKPELPSLRYLSSSSSSERGSSASSKDTKPPGKDLDSILTSDRKLTDAERKRRIENGLCLYCGSSEHTEHPGKTRPTKNTSPYNTPARSAGATLDSPPSGRPDQMSTSVELIDFPTVSVDALLDCGASESFISNDFALRHNLPLRQATFPRQLYLFDGSISQAGPVKRECRLQVRLPSCGLTFTGTFLLCNLPPQSPMVLGLDFFRQNNPEVDWSTGVLSRRSSASPKPASDNRDSDEVTSQPQIAFARLVNTSPTLLSPVDDEVIPELEELRLQVPSHYHQYISVFSAAKASTLSPHRGCDHTIDLIGPPPKPGPILPMSTGELQEVRSYLDEMLEKGFIRPSSSSTGAGILFVPKSDGTNRLCVDYRRLNAVTRKDRYPLPPIDTLLQQLQSAQYYSKIDLRSAYHQIRIAEGHEWKTAFRTRYGSFEYLVMPFGLSNAPSSFQRFVNTIFHDMVDRCVVVYLDDILVYSTSHDEHVRHVQEVLARLHSNSLHANATKCVFHQQEVEYLGYIVQPNGLSMNPEKVASVLAWPTPTNVKGVQSFLGFANFYRRFIRGYSIIATPLTALTKKTMDFRWSDEAQTAFDTLKNAFSSAPILAHFRAEFPTMLETDASDYAIGCILSQHHPDGVWHPIGFYSRKFSTSELNYPIHDKELGAIISALEHWRPLVLSLTSQLRVYTDHHSLEYFMSTKVLTRRQARWAERMADYDFMVYYRPGKLSSKPDTLSRRDDVYPSDGGSFADHNPQNIQPLLRQSRLMAVSTSDFSILSSLELLTKITDAQKNDPEVQRIRETLDKDTESHYSIDQDRLLYDNRILVPDIPELQCEVVRSRHDHPTAGHPGRTKTLQLIRRDFYWPRMSALVDRYVATCHSCSRYKKPRRKPHGLLQPLPLSERPWSSISMDFIEQLPVSRGFDAILVVVDRFSKMALFIPSTSTCTAVDLADLFMRNVFSKFGVPQDVVSDRGSKFTATFWSSLAKSLALKQNLSTAYHPQTDGQTERVNQILEAYLRHYISYHQDDWYDLLPIAEFAYNNAEHSSTRQSPFIVNYGYSPAIDINQLTMPSQRAQEYAEARKMAQENAKESLEIAVARYKRYADMQRIPAPEFRPDQLVWLDARNISTTRPSKKLAEKRLGPFRIARVISDTAVKLDLPASMPSIHPVFHVSLLTPASDAQIPGQHLQEPEPIQVDGHNEWEVGEILDSRIRYRRLEYLVLWDGFIRDGERSTWEPVCHVSHATDAIAEFHMRYPDKPKPDDIRLTTGTRPARIQ